ncbi:carbon storage regulator CsrA [Paenibacillus sp. FSL K6-1230]|uniref:carbon storage regulator CsrA n=1 Tax=Paenibacillus sp. FSL K6-1230 TaxID=2921603 RepID=UPI0030F6EFC6
MLILSRNKGEKIMINDDIVISVIEISGDQVRLGITAPSHVSIYREEIYAIIQNQNKEAVHLNDNIENILYQIQVPKKK